MTLIKITLNIIIVFNIIFVLILLNIMLIEKLFKKPHDVKYYYINNFFVTIISNYIYIIFYVIFLYCLRIWKCNEFLNLKKIYIFCKDITEIFILLPMYIQVFICFLLILLLLFLCLNTVLFHRYFLHQVYILYLNARYHPEYKYSHNIFDKRLLTEPSDSDLISYFIYNLSFKLTYNYLKPSEISWAYYYTALPWFHFHKLISNTISNFYYKKILIPFSPLFVIIYDCYYYDFMLTHIYYYMLLYVPLMLWRKITILISTESFNVCELVWNILYKKENCIYALSIDHAKLFEVYLINGLKRIHIDDNSYDMDSTHTLYLLKASKFIFNNIENFFENIEGLEIHNFKPNFIDNNLVVIKWIDLKETKENWVLIMDKTITNE